MNEIDTKIQKLQQEIDQRNAEITKFRKEIIGLKINQNGGLAHVPSVEEYSDAEKKEIVERYQRVLKFEETRGENLSIRAIADANDQEFMRVAIRHYCTAALLVLEGDDLESFSKKIAEIQVVIESDMYCGIWNLVKYLDGIHAEYRELFSRRYDSFGSYAGMDSHFILRYNIAEPKHFNSSKKPDRKIEVEKMTGMLLSCTKK